MDICQEMAKEILATGNQKMIEVYNARCRNGYLACVLIENESTDDKAQYFRNIYTKICKAT